MSDIQISGLLDELCNKEAYNRNAAIKKIITNKIKDERVTLALQEIIENDPSMAIRDFARAAIEMRESEVYIEENEPMLQTNDAVKIGIVIGIIPTILVVLIPFLFGGGFLGLLFVLPVGIPGPIGTPMGILGGVAGALAGKSLMGSRGFVIIGSVLGTILGTIVGLYWIGKAVTWS